MRFLFWLVAPAALHAQMITANPCTLLTPAEVIAATSDTVRTTVLSQYTAPVCTVITSDSTARITIKIETTRDYGDDYWDVANDSTKPIPSLGDRANVKGIPPVTRFLRRGHVYTIIYTNINLTPDAIRDREKALATFAVARAP